MEITLKMHWRHCYPLMDASGMSTLNEETKLYQKRDFTGFEKRLISMYEKEFPGIKFKIEWMD